MTPLFYLKTMPPAAQVGKNDFPVLVKGGKGELNRDPALLTVMIRTNYPWERSEKLLTREKSGIQRDS